MDMQLSSSVVVIAGGAQGIGLATANAFAAEAANVALLDIHQNTAVVAKEIAAQHQVQAIGIQTDATSLAALENSAARINLDLGRIDHVVCAAGGGSGKYGYPFWNLTPADWPRVLEINLMTAVNTAHAFQPYLQQAATAHENASLLLFTSVAAQIGSQTDPPYSAAKAAVINFAQCAAKDFAAFKIRANALSPGMVQTAINKSVWQAWHDQQPAADRLSYDEWTSSKISQISPLGRWQQPEEIAAMAVFLASPYARNITGQTLNVDGGQVMHS